LQEQPAPQVIATAPESVIDSGADTAAHDARFLISG
jgi:hypothetical protein